MLDKNNNFGGILLIALLIMTAIITISSATGVLIMNEIQQSSMLDKSIVAFYAAESAVERGLYQARQQDFDASEFSLIESLFSNEAHYLIVAADAEDMIIKNLSQDESFQLDLYKPHTLSAMDDPIKSLRFNWTNMPSSWLEVRWVPWTIDGLFYPDRETHFLSRGVTLTPGDNFMELEDETDYLYTVRITARGNNVSNLEIYAYDDLDPLANCSPLTDCQVNIPGRVKIKGLGEYAYNQSNSAKQAIIVTMSEVVPLSGLYDYVIFSEEAIEK